MSTQTGLQMSLLAQQTPNMRAELVDFFMENLGREFRTDYLHIRFGTSVRTRISELNNMPGVEIAIHNRWYVNKENRKRVSVYWATRRAQ
jgi:hypothetical protein